MCYMNLKFELEMKEIFILVIVESYKNTPPLNEDSVLFSQNRNSVGKVSNKYIFSFNNVYVLCLTEAVCCSLGF